MTPAMKDRPMIIFDMDGTLLDSAPGITKSLTHAIRHLGHDFHPPAGVQELFGPPMNQVVAELLRPFGDDRVEQCVQTYREHYRDYGLYDCSPYPGIAEALQSLIADGVSLEVATSKRQEFADKMLRHAGLHGMFEEVRGTTADGSLDDKADLLRLMSASLSHSRSCLLMIGDKRDDMLAASKNAIPAIGVTWGYGTAQELTESGAVALLDSPVDLPGLVLRLLAQYEPVTRSYPFQNCA
jgi:phosphoglycolate phosphatase